MDIGPWSNIMPKTPARADRGQLRAGAVGPLKDESGRTTAPPAVRNLTACPGFPSPYAVSGTPGGPSRHPAGFGVGMTQHNVRRQDGLREHPGMSRAPASPLHPGGGPGIRTDNRATNVDPAGHVGRPFAPRRGGRVMLKT